MRTLEAPLPDPDALFVSVSASRKMLEVRARLATIQPTVVGAYRSYEAETGDLTSLDAIDVDPDTRQDLRSNYGSLYGSHRDVRDALLNAVPGGNCPLCGDREATTLDHYLPHSEYPEFAILPLNLVPCCKDCNTEKLADFKSDDGAVYLHLYVDRLAAEEQFLSATVEVDLGTPTIEFDINGPACATSPLADRVRSHFAGLGLGTYYRRIAIQEAGYRVQSTEQQLRDGATPDEVRAGLRQDAGHAATIHGANHWRYVALEAFADNDDFCAGACSGWLPL